MNEIITENDTYINYLLDSPNTTDRNSVIIDCQLTAFVFSNEAKKFAKENGYSGKTVGEYVNWIKDNYSWKVKKDPIPKWNVRLNSLKGSKNNYEILKKYNDFILQTQDLRDNISKGVDAFDEYVNMQIDMAKGG